MINKKKNKINNEYIERDNSFQSFSKKKKAESLQNLANEILKDNNSNSYNNSKDIQEIHIDFHNNPKLAKAKHNIENENENENNSLSFSNQMNDSYSLESNNSPNTFQPNENNSDYMPYQNNTYTHNEIKPSEAKLKKYPEFKKIYTKKYNYYKLPKYMNNYENNKNNFLKKSDNNEYNSQNNSFNINSPNIEEDSINDGEEKNIIHKKSLTPINSIPRPQKFKKKIPLNLSKKTKDNVNNPLYLDEKNNNRINYNINLYNQNNRYYDIKTVNNADLYKNNRKIFKNNNIADYKYNNNYDNLSNRTLSPNYLKDIEKIGINLSFNNKKKNDSIDLISPEIFDDLKIYSYEKPKKNIIVSDLDINKINDYNNPKDNILLNRKMENYDKLRKKYIKRLSSYLLKNRKPKKEKENVDKKVKYNIIDVNEKIKKERRNRSLSNNSKFNKKELIKDSPLATLIKKEDDKGGKVDFKLPTKNLRNKRNFNNKSDDIKPKYIVKNKVSLLSLKDDKNINKNKIILDAAKTIQKWWRDSLIRFFTELCIIKIQSVFRGFLFRKKFSKKNNNIKNDLIQNKGIISNLKNEGAPPSLNKNEEKKINISKSNNNPNNIFIQQNNRFRIVPDKRESNTIDINEKNTDNDLNKTSNNKYPPLINYKNEAFEIKNDNSSPNNLFDNNKSLKSEYNNSLPNPIILNKNKLEICFYTKEYYKNIGDNQIKNIQNNYRKYLKNKNNNLEPKNQKEDIIKYPIIFPSYINKIRLKKLNIKTNRQSYAILKNNKNNILNLKPKNNNDKYIIDKPKNIISNENNISIKGNPKNEISNSLLLKKYNNKKDDNETSKNPQIINYMHNIEFSINKQNNNEIIKKPLNVKCYFSKENFIRNKMGKNNNNLNKSDLSLSPSNKTEYQITKNISDYIKSSHSQRNYNFSNNNKYLISYFSNEIKGKQKNEPLYEIRTFNTNIISKKDNNNDKNNNLEIDNQNKSLNYSAIKIEPIIKKPKSTIYFLTKEYIDNDKQDKYKEINSKLKTKYFIVNDENNKENNEEKIYKYPFDKKYSYISKIYKKDTSKAIIPLQKYFKNLFNKSKSKPENTFIKLLLLNNYITKEYKDNSLDKNKIILIQKAFRKFRNKKKDNKDNKENILENENILNDPKITSNKSSIQSRNNNNRNSLLKNTQTNENISTTYRTNDNFIKTNSINDDDKKDNIIENRNLIDKLENKKNNINSYYNNSEEDEKENEYNENNDNLKQDDDKTNYLNNDNIRKAYQIKIYKSKKDDEPTKESEILKMLIQRIKKNINQYVFKKIKINNYINKDNQINDKKDNDNDKDNNNDYNNDISLISMSSDYEPKKENFFFNTIRRHLKINKMENNWEGNNEVINLLKNNIPDYFKNYPNTNFIPYINEDQEENLINKQLYEMNDDQLADYMNKCYKIEKNIFTITPDMIKNRLKIKPLKNRNIFTITKYMDDLYDDYINGRICQNCCCKNDELCLFECPCHHKNNSNIINNKLDNMNENNILNNNEKIRNTKNLLDKKFYESDDEPQSIKILNDEINTNTNRNDLLYNNAQNNKNYKKSISSNENNKNKINNDNIRKNSITNSDNDNYDQSNIYDDIDNINNEDNNEGTIINESLSKKKLNIIIPFPNQYNEDNNEDNKINNSLYKKELNIIPYPYKNNEESNEDKIINKSLYNSKKVNGINNKLNLLRYQQEQNRKKNREIIKLRDTNINYDNEIYENI